MARISRPWCSRAVRTKGNNALLQFRSCKVRAPPGSHPASDPVNCPILNPWSCRGNPVRAMHTCMCRGDSNFAILYSRSGGDPRLAAEPRHFPRSAADVGHHHQHGNRHRALQTRQRLRAQGTRRTRASIVYRNARRSRWCAVLLCSLHSIFQWHRRIPHPNHQEKEVEEASWIFSLASISKHRDNLERLCRL